MTDPAESTDPDRNESIMPLLATSSHGGPFDTNAYIAGWEMGALAQLLNMHVSGCAINIHAENVRQADLIAMHAGFTMRCWDEVGERVNVEFLRAADDL